MNYVNQGIGDCFTQAQSQLMTGKGSFVNTFHKGTMQHALTWGMNGSSQMPINSLLRRCKGMTHCWNCCRRMLSKNGVGDQGMHGYQSFGTLVMSDRHAIRVGARRKKSAYLFVAALIGSCCGPSNLSGEPCPVRIGVQLVPFFNTVRSTGTRSREDCDQQPDRMC